MRRGQGVLLRDGEELVELWARDLRTCVESKAHQGSARVAPSRLHQRQKVPWGDIGAASSLGQLAWL